MKKFYTLVLASVLFVMAAKAQLSYGLKAGVNIAKEHFTVTQFTDDYKVFFNGGAFVNYKTTLPIAVQLEVFYAGEGTKELNTTTSTSGSIKEGYLNIPLLAQYRTSFGLYVETGPQLGFLLSSKESYGSSIDANIKQYYKSTDISWCVGAGYEIPEGPVKGLGLNARYAPSLTGINKSTVGGGVLKNNVISIDLTYRLFAKGKK